MNHIEITGKDNQNIVFTARSVTVGGEEFPYSSIDAIAHNAEDRTYSIAGGNRNAIISYSEKDAKAVSTLFSRVAEMRKIEISTCEPTKEDAEPAVSSEKGGIFQRPVILIVEAVIAVILLALGVYLLLFT